jgi:hypothetical protein
VNEGWRDFGSGGCNGFLGAAFASYEDPNAFDHFCGRRGTLGQEHVGVERAVEGVDGAGDDHGGESGMQLLGAANELVAVHLRHQEIAEDEIE